MISVLSDLLAADDGQAKLTTDLRALVDGELSSKSGASAAALKVAYKAITTFADGYYQTTIEAMVPDMLSQLQPFWSDFQAAGGGQFGDYLVKRGEEVSEALVTVTDTMMKNSEHPTVAKAYQVVRGGASKHVEAALPAVGAFIEKHAA